MRNASVLFALLVMSLLAGPAQAQETTVDDIEVKLVGILFAEKAKGLPDVPIKTTVEPKKARAFRLGEHGALVMPERGLSASTFTEAGSEPKPVGQLWTHKITPLIDGQAAPEDKLLLVSAEVRDEERSFALFLLGVRKGSDGKPELLVFGKGVEPILVLPLVPESSAEDPPLELSGKRVDDSSGELALLIVGKYRAVLRVAALDD
jgi:hypothetical protein